MALCEIPIPMPHFLSGQEARLVGIIPYKPLSVQIGGGFSTPVAADQFEVEVVGSSDYAGHN
jgi:hypothetical protein